MMETSNYDFSTIQHHYIEFLLKSQLLFAQETLLFVQILLMDFSEKTLDKGDFLRYNEKTESLGGAFYENLRFGCKGSHL